MTTPGSLIDDRVITGDGLLQLVVVQPEGRQPSPFAAWANGARPVEGEQLGQEAT